MVIVIDGLAGSGKSSTARALSRKLNIKFLDSGALYRAVTYFWIRNGKPDKDKFFQMLPDIDLDAEADADDFIVLLNGENVSGLIRNSNVAGSVSEIASWPEVRICVNRFMRELVKTDKFIADGRDLGTAVFPDADLKFFMNASLEERARRRYLELKDTEADITLPDVTENLKKRDHKDKSRSADPLKKADDAIEIDTTGKTFNEQVDEISAIIKQQLEL